MYFTSSKTLAAPRYSEPFDRSLVVAKATTYKHL